MRGLLAVGLAISLTIVAVAPAAIPATDPIRELDLIRPSRPTRAPDFTVPSLAPPPIRLGDFKGKVVFVNFWATWCPPCKEEMPSMERLYRHHKDQGFTILAISIDTNTAAVAPFVRYFKLTFHIGLDPKFVVANDYTVRALPSSFLIDRNGDIVAIALGPRDWDGPAAHAMIESVLK